MLLSSIPAKFNIPWGNGAGAGFIRSIPQASQIGVQAGAASLTDGYPPVTFQPVGSGGVPPFGQDTNGIFKQVTQWNQWQAAGGPIQYDATFQTNIGGYPQGALIASAVTLGVFWLSTTDGNTTNPDTGGAGWYNPFPTTGDTKWRPTAETLTAWVRMNSLTVGNGSSNGTERANADTAALFSWVWTNFTNTQCPLLNSSGSPVSRGGSAASDFAANNQITLPDMRGRFPGGLDTMGAAGANRLVGGTFATGNSSTAGSTGGEAAHVLVTGELAAHTHNFSGTTGTESATHNHSFTINQIIIPPSGGANVTVLTPGSGAAGFTTGTESATHTHAFSGTTNNGTGGGAGHNTLPPFMLGTWYLKL